MRNSAVCTIKQIYILCIGMFLLACTHRAHNSFALTIKELESMLAAEEAETQQAVAQNPHDFLASIAEALTLPQDILLLVDKQHSLPKHYYPPDLVELSQYAELTVNRDGLMVRALIIPDLLAMVAAAKEDHIILDISSAYRSYEYQEKLFAYWTDTIGAEAAARSSAKAGTSQHQLGTTIDFGSITPEFAKHPSGQWLAKNAWRFGFSLSYPQDMEALTGYMYEPWHYRYLSPAITGMEKQFFSGIQQKNADVLA